MLFILRWHLVRYSCYISASDIMFSSDNWYIFLFTYSLRRYGLEIGKTLLVGTGYKVIAIYFYDYLSIVIQYFCIWTFQTLSCIWDINLECWIIWTPCVWSVMYYDTKFYCYDIWYSRTCICYTYILSFRREFCSDNMLYLFSFYHLQGLNLIYLTQDLSRRISLKSKI